MAPKPVMTAYTLSLDTLQTWRIRPRQAARHCLTIKLGREATWPGWMRSALRAPDPRIILDANGAERPRSYIPAPHLVPAGRAIVETACPVNARDSGRKMRGVLPV